VRVIKVKNWFNNYRYFGTMTRSMITLFHLSLQSDELTAIIRATAEVQYWPPFFIAFFTLFMALCLFNTIIGVIVDKTVTSLLQDESHKRTLRQMQVEAIEDLASLMFELDSNHDQRVSLDELQAGASNPRLQQVLRQIHLPVGFTVEELFMMIDEDGDGFISRNEFIGGLFRTVFSSEFQRECMVRLGLANVRKTMCTIKDQIVAQMKVDHQELMCQMQSYLSNVGVATAPGESLPGYQILGTGHEFVGSTKDASYDSKRLHEYSVELSWPEFDPVSVTSLSQQHMHIRLPEDNHLHGTPSPPQPTCTRSPEIHSKLGHMLSDSKVNSMEEGLQTHALDQTLHSTDDAKRACRATSRSKATNWSKEYELGGLPCNLHRASPVSSRGSNNRNFVYM